MNTKSLMQKTARESSKRQSSSGKGGPITQLAERLAHNDQLSKVKVI
jgi:hypothetical protein